MTVSLIAALGNNRALGYKNKLPWHIPADLKRFKALTTGHPIIMGRKTYESIGRPLPNRTNIVITRDKNLAIQGCVVCGSLEEAVKKALAVASEEIFVIGGGQIYEQALPLVTKMYLTFVDAAPDGDAFFPVYNEADWHETLSETVEQSEQSPYSYVYKVLERKP